VGEGEGDNSHNKEVAEEMAECVGVPASELYLMYMSLTSLTSV
jgi:hypothetical protein